MGPKATNCYRRCFQVHNHEMASYRIASACLLRTRDRAIHKAWVSHGTKPEDLSRFLVYFVYSPGAEDKMNDVIGLGIKCIATTPSVDQKRRIQSSISQKLESMFNEAAIAFAQADGRADAALREIQEEEAAIALAQAACRATPAQEAKDSADDYDDVCVICLDDSRSKEYKPCGHSVCCGPCARMLWTRSPLRPWCAREVEDPSLY